MSELDDLRRQVQAAHRRAGNKVSRLRREKGVEVGGTKFDVRRDPKNIKRYTKTQLNNYLNDLTSFTSRSNNFVSSRQKQAIPSSMWREYKSLEKRYNAAGERNFSSMENVFEPQSNQTIGERRRGVTHKVKRMSGEVANLPYSPSNLQPHQVEGTEGLKAEIKRMRKRVERNYHPESIAAGRKHLNKILKRIPDKQLRKDINSLTDYQFDILWNGTKFGKELMPKYLEMKILAMGARDDIVKSIDGDTHLDSARDMVKWAGEQPEKPVTRKPAPSRGKAR